MREDVGGMLVRPAPALDEKDPAGVFLRGATRVGRVDVRSCSFPFGIVRSWGRFVEFQALGFGFLLAP